LRRQRLRRDAARAVRVGRQAAGREPGRGRTGQRFPAKACRKTALAAGLRQFRSQIKAKKLKAFEKLLAKAHTRDSTQALGRLTTVVDRRRQIISDPPMIVPIEEVFAEVQADAISAQLRAVLHKYRRTLQSDRRRLEEFALGQVARKVVGVGSVGTRAWVVLMDSGDGEEPLFFQAKEAQPSVLAEYAGPTSTPTRAGESSPGSTCSRPRATSSSAEPGSPAPTGQTATITSASCGTGNSPCH